MSCRLCSGPLRLLLDLGTHPISKHYAQRPDELSHPVYPIRLTVCERCGLAQLIDGPPAKALYDRYITMSSWKRPAHLESLAAEIVQLTPPNGWLVEVGCGDGEFLDAVARAGLRHVIGIEPASDGASIAAQRFHTVQNYLTPRLARALVRDRKPFDTLVCRHVLEHIEDLQGFLKAMRCLVRPGGHAIIEVPDFAFQRDHRDYTIWEEHVNLFTAETLAAAMGSVGFTCQSRALYAFSGQSMSMVFVRSDDCQPVDGTACIEPEIAYAAGFFEAKEQLRSRVAGRRTALYGASGRAFCLANYCELWSQLECVIDRQPEKQDAWTPEGRVAMLGPDAIDRVEVCLLGVGAEYEDRVMAQHADWPGEWLSISPPSPRMYAGLPSAP